MGPLSPSSTSSKTSPKPPNPNPNLNPFSALSPHLPENKLLQQDALSSRERYLRRARAAGVITYSREKLLRIARRCKQEGWQKPADMGALESWYGVVSSTIAPHEDPAIASIGPPSGRRGNAGGFGEGFGFGGGIGNGRGIGRGGGRNIGLRRQPDNLDTNGLPLPPDRPLAQMGKISTRNAPERGNDQVHLNGRSRRDDGEWRRGERPQPTRNGEASRRPPWNVRYEEESTEPAWMEDDSGPSTSVQAAIESESLIQFVPGEDMIAAHKRAMKAHDSRELPSFFGADPAIVQPAAKPKVFDAANYLRPAKPDSDDESEVIEPRLDTNAFQSRFQRFFGGPAAPTPPAQSPPPPPPEPRMDEHMAKLMGMLKTSQDRTEVPLPRPADHQIASPPYPGRHAISPPPVPFGHPQESRHFGHGQGPPPPMPHPNVLLQQLYSHDRPPPDPLHLMAQTQRHAVSPNHMSMPANMFRPIEPSYHQPLRRDGGISPSDLLREIQQPQYSRTVPYHGSPVNPPDFMPPNFHSGPPGMHPPQRGYPRSPEALGQAQQDMLASLFSGLGPRERS